MKTSDVSDSPPQDLGNDDGTDKFQKRAHHNALERKRRDHIKDRFTDLRNAVPIIKDERASRSVILIKSAEYINSVTHGNSMLEAENRQLKEENDIMRREIDRLEQR